MPIRSESLPYVLPPGLVAAAALATGRPVVAALAAVTAVALGAFFRDPERRSGAQPDAVLSPADGRVLEVESGDGGVSVAIFLSIFNVHVTRAPASGRLLSCRRTGHGYRAAYHPDARHNTRFAMLIETPAGPIELDLMAGAVARRIVPWVQAGDALVRGQRIALIRFGSRAEIRLPPPAEAAVAVGDRVRAGVTPLARLPGMGRGSR